LDAGGNSTARLPGAVPAAFAGGPVFDPRAKLQAQALNRAAPTTDTRAPLPSPAPKSESTGAPATEISASAPSSPAKLSGLTPGALTGKRAVNLRAKTVPTPTTPRVEPAVNPTVPSSPGVTTPAPFAKSTSLDAKAVFKQREPAVPAVRQRVFSNLGTKATEEAGLALPPPAQFEDVEMSDVPIRPEPKLPVINLTSPLPTAAELAKRTSARAVKPETVDVGAVVAAVVQTESKTPGLIRAFASVLKWVGMGAILLIGGFYFTRVVVLPLHQELKQPTTNGTVDRQAPIAVQVLQYTRKVVAENNQKVDKLNTIIHEAEKPGASIAANHASPSAAPKSSPVPGGEERARQVQSVLTEWKIGPVSGGYEPRVVLNGRLVKAGEMAHHNLGLRFVQVDEQARELHFIDGKGTVYRRSY